MVLLLSPPSNKHETCSKGVYIQYILQHSAMSSCVCELGERLNLDLCHAGDSPAQKLMDDNSQRSSKLALMATDFERTVLVFMPRQGLQSCDPLSVVNLERCEACRKAVPSREATQVVRARAIPTLSTSKEPCHNNLRLCGQASASPRRMSYPWPVRVIPWCLIGRCLLQEESLDGPCHAERRVAP